MTDDVHVRVEPNGSSSLCGLSGIWNYRWVWEHSCARELKESRQSLDALCPRCAAVLTEKALTPGTG